MASLEMKGDHRAGVMGWEVDGENPSEEMAFVTRPGEESCHVPGIGRKVGLPGAWR